eukprot:Nitzschia sp. Nitz4//scaffold133_size116822//112507//113565//NITZ4_003828-RA/size116822-processed-gene-0.44-mRNA-1//1//CDS//3329535459//5820//frame0
MYRTSSFLSAILLLASLSLWSVQVSSFAPSTTQLTRHLSRIVTSSDPIYRIETSKETSSQFIHSSSQLHMSEGGSGALPAARLDVSCLARCNDSILQGLASLDKQVRGPFGWMKTPKSRKELVSVQPSQLMKSRIFVDWLASLCPGHSFLEELFPSQPALEKFDVLWNQIMFDVLPKQEIEELLDHGQSNTYPLLLQLVALPPHTKFPVHVHPGVELDIPIVGKLHEHLVDVQVPRNELSRQANGCSNVQANDEPATSDDFDTVHKTLTDRLTQEYKVSYVDDTNHFTLQHTNMQGAFEAASINTPPTPSQHNIWVAGDCLVNSVGSVHQTYTSDQPCLLLALHPNVHGHFA